MPKGLSKSEIMRLVAGQCDSFTQKFLAANSDKFADLTSPHVEDAEQKLEWHDSYLKFVAQAELMMQSVALQWGVAAPKAFEEEFVEAAMESTALDGFLSLTEYKSFIAKMYEHMHQGAERDAKQTEDMMSPIPHRSQKTQNRLAELDKRLAELEVERTALLVERRSLIGCGGESSATTSLKSQIERQRWKADVGND